MKKGINRDSLLPCPVRPYGARSPLLLERRGPRPWSRDQRTTFLHHLSVQDSLEQALVMARVARAEAFAERVRDRTFARAWERSVADRMARLPEALLDHALEGLRTGSDPKDPMVRQAASIGQWLVEKWLPAISGNIAPDRGKGGAAPPSATAGHRTDSHGIDRQLADKIAEVRARLVDHSDPRDGAAAGGACDPADLAK